MMDLINLGSVQAPYWQTTLTLSPNQTHKIDYVYNSFNLLEASITNVLEVTFGGAAVQSKFSAGMSYKLNEPVSYIQLFNTSDEPLEITFALAIGEIRDSRLTVSGKVNALSETVGYTKVSAGTLTAPQNFDFAANSNLAIFCTSGTIILNCTATGVNVNNLVLSAGQSWEIPLVINATLKITGTGTFNYNIAEY